jgi:hypothetical protein
MADKCEGEDTAETRRVLLQKACELTRASLKAAPVGNENRFRAANNLAYYLLDLHRTDTNALRQDPDLADCISALEGRITAQGDHPDAHLLDTLCRYYAAEGKIDKAVMAAERVEQILAKTPAGVAADGPPAATLYYAIVENLNPAERRMLDHALWVLRNHGFLAQGQGTAPA